MKLPEFLKKLLGKTEEKKEEEVKLEEWNMIKTFKGYRYPLDTNPELEKEMCDKTGITGPVIRAVYKCKDDGSVDWDGHTGYVLTTDALWIVKWGVGALHTRRYGKPEEIPLDSINQDSIGLENIRKEGKNRENSVYDVEIEDKSGNLISLAGIRSEFYAVWEWVLDLNTNEEELNNRFLESLMKNQKASTSEEFAFLLGTEIEKLEEEATEKKNPWQVDVKPIISDKGAVEKTNTSEIVEKGRND